MLVEKAMFQMGKMYLLRSPDQDNNLFEFSFALSPIFWCPFNHSPSKRKKKRHQLARDSWRLASSGNLLRKEIKRPQALLDAGTKAPRGATPDWCFAWKFATLASRKRALLSVCSVGPYSIRGEMGNHDSLHQKRSIRLPASHQFAGARLLPLATLLHGLLARKATGRSSNG